MFRPLVSLLLAGTIAITSLGLTAAPARADNKDATRAILGIAALYLLLNHDNDRRHRGHNRGHGQVRKALPRGCASVLNVRRNATRVFNRACLRRNMPRQVFHRLPGRCETTVRTRRGLRNVFLARCLRRNGWRVI